MQHIDSGTEIRRAKPRLTAGLVGRIGLCLLTGMWVLAIGCDSVSPANSAGTLQPLLFSAPLRVNGETIGEAFVDTGGAYEVLLSEPFGLDIVDASEVLAFGGDERLGVTEPFVYEYGGMLRLAPGALVGLSACECNGIGFLFFQRTGVVLSLDFPTQRLDFLLQAPPGDVTLPFAPPPDVLSDFNSAFINVSLSSGDAQQEVLALLDTGASVSVMRRGLVGSPPLVGNLQNVRVAHPQLGTVQAVVGLFETEGLPDLIIGTDIMGAWADGWYFTFTQSGGAMSIVLDTEEAAEPPLVLRSANFATPQRP